MIVKPEQLTVVLYPHPVLRQKAAPVQEITEEIREVAARMAELMVEHEGIGLAAPQVGLPWRMFVARDAEDPEDPTINIYINPELSAASTRMGGYEEGCLSIPEVRATIHRPLGITIQALNEQGEPVTRTSDQMPARVWQHEFDHLNGVLILDHMSPLDKLSFSRVLRQLERDFSK